MPEKSREEPAGVSTGIQLEKSPFGEQFFRRLLDSLYDGVYFVDRERRILYWNQGAELLSGYKAEEVVGRFCNTNILQHVDEAGEHLCVSKCPLVYSVTTGQPISKRVFLKHKDSRRIAVEVHVMPLRDDEGEILGGVEIFRDASSAVALETAYDRLRECAEKDPLTNAANRRSLDRILESQLDLVKRTGIPFSIVMTDVDHFKQINDTCGHAVGDQALIAFSERLQSCCRKTDVVGRFGGDEFLVLLPEQRLGVASRVAERIRQAVAALSTTSALPPMTASLGIAEAQLEDTPATLLERVDTALYRAKNEGRNRTAQSVVAPVAHPQEDV